MNIVTMPDRVYVELIKKPKGMFELPDKDSPHGKVLKLGVKCEQLDVGDIVYFNKFTDVSDGYAFVRYRDVLVVN